VNGYGWEDLDETGYRRLIEAAGEYEVFADERSRTVVKRSGQRKKPDRKKGVQPSYFEMIHVAVSKSGYFDPAIEGLDEDQRAGKQIFQRARQAVDVKYKDDRGATAWRLFKTVKRDNHAVYQFEPDPDFKFALIFLPRS